MKKVIILWHNGGRLANQLWLYSSVLAYCLENDYKLENFSFFEYSRYFNIEMPNKLVDFLFFKSYILFFPIKKVFGLVNEKIYNYIFRKYYLLFVKIVSFFTNNKIVNAKHVSSDIKIYYLSPSGNENEIFSDFNKSKDKLIFLKGWLYRNPVGIAKYRKEIIRFFKPQDKHWNVASNFVQDARVNFKNIIGVHIRKGDYVGNSNLYFLESEVNIFLNELLLNFNLNNNDTCFVICSDEKVDEEKFSKNLNIKVSDSEFIVDLFILSLCDKLIASDSTFGAFASYYGNIPMIVFKKNGINWSYYMGRDKYFENSNCTTAFLGDNSR